LQQIFVFVPVLLLEVVGIRTSDDVNFSKMVALLNFNVSGILIYWQHEACFAFQEEANKSNIFTLRVDVLFVVKVCRREKWAEP
jgi:hypothetical protein